MQHGVSSTALALLHPEESKPPSGPAALPRPPPAAGEAHAQARHRLALHAGGW